MWFFNPKNTLKIRMWKIYSSIKLSGNVQTCQELHQWCRQNWANNLIFLIFYIHQVLLIKSTTLHSSGIFQSSTLGHIDHGYLFNFAIFIHLLKKIEFNEHCLWWTWECPIMVLEWIFRYLWNINEPVCVVLIHWRLPIGAKSVFLCRWIVAESVNDTIHRMKIQKLEQRLFDRSYLIHTNMTYNMNRGLENGKTS